MPREQWEVLIPHHHPGFISWETYEANTARLRGNWRRPRELAGGAVREGNEVPVSFDLPMGDYGTRLAEAPARYWELAVLADTPGLDFSAKFLIPVYGQGREIGEQVLVPAQAP